MSPFPISHQALLDAGYDPNFMLHPWIRQGYDDERKSALFFAVSNNDVPSSKVLLEGGAMTNQDPIKCLQVPKHVTDARDRRRNAPLLFTQKWCPQWWKCGMTLIRRRVLQVALRLGNYELINLLLRFGANVNYYCKVNTTHFPSALQYALEDEVGVAQDPDLRQG